MNSDFPRMSNCKAKRIKFEVFCGDQRIRAGIDKYDANENFFFAAKRYETVKKGNWKLETVNALSYLLEN